MLFINRPLLSLSFTFTIQLILKHSLTEHFLNLQFFSTVKNLEVLLLVALYANDNL